MDERNCRNLHNETIQAVRCPKVFIDLPQSGLSKTGPPPKKQRKTSLWIGPSPSISLYLLAKKSKFFTKKLLHGDEVFWSEKWAFSSLEEALPDEKSGRRRRKIAHNPCICARFLLKFCASSRFCKHTKFSKVNAKFSKVVDFFFLNERLFLLKTPQSSNNQQFSKPSQNSLIFVQKFFRG